MKRLKSNKTIEEIAQEGVGNIEEIVEVANGYQPKGGPKTLPAPPKGGSNAVKEAIKVEVEIKNKCSCKQYHNDVCEKINCEKDCKFYGKANCYNCIHKGVCHLRTNSYCEESVKEDGCDHYVSITSEESNYLITYRQFSDLYSMSLVIDKELVLADNMHNAIQKLKKQYDSVYDILAISKLDESVNFWEDIN